MPRTVLADLWQDLRDTGRVFRGPRSVVMVVLLSVGIAGSSGVNRVAIERTTP